MHQSQAGKGAAYLLLVVVKPEAHAEVGNICLLDVIALRPWLPVVLMYPVHLDLRSRAQGIRLRPRAEELSRDPNKLPQTQYLSSLAAREKSSHEQNAGVVGCGGEGGPGGDPQSALVTFVCRLHVRGSPSQEHPMRA